MAEADDEQAKASQAAGQEGQRAETLEHGQGLHRLRRVHHARASNRRDAVPGQVGGAPRPGALSAPISRGGATRKAGSSELQGAHAAGFGIASDNRSSRHQNCGRLSISPAQARKQFDRAQTSRRVDEGLR